MMPTTTEPSKQRRARWCVERVLPVAAAALAAGLLAAGCGGSPSTPSSNKPTGGSQAGSQAIAYSRCMRSHGVPSFPDPTISRSGGHVGIGMSIPASVSGSPAFKTAEQACGKLAPGGEGGSGGAAPITAQQHQEIVQFAACVRSHGISNFPDPDATGTFHVVGIKTNAPAFTTAIQKCQVNGMPLNISSQQGSGSQ
jgi:hypothetical protein